MRNWLSLTLVTLAWVAFVACGGDTSEGPPKGSGGSGGSSGGGLTCDTLADPPEGCDAPCGGDPDCGAGTFCLSGTCAAQCTSDDDCNANASCSSRGRCVPDMNTGGNNGFGGGNACQSVTITPDFSVPNVMFLVDQSGSMAWELANNSSPEAGEPDRWEAAHEAITGIIGDLQSIVRFGLTSYESDDGFGPNWPDSPPFRECPVFHTEVDFALNNATAISADYPATFPGGEDTPTGDSIRTLVSSIQDNPPPADGPTIIVLATDGAPDSCEYPDPGWNSAEGIASRQEVVTEAGNAHDQGIDVFVLWIGVLTDTDIEAHLQEVANAGVNDSPSDPDAEFWVGSTTNALDASFRAIIAESISCDIPMLETFRDPAAACAEGDVRLDGVPLDCVGAGGDGWRVKPGDDQVIELLGTACDTLKSGDVEFTASFPCGSVTVD